MKDNWKKLSNLRGFGVFKSSQLATLMNGMSIFAKFFKKLRILIFWEKHYFVPWHWCKFLPAAWLDSRFSERRAYWTMWTVYLFEKKLLWRDLQTGTSCLRAQIFCPRINCEQIKVCQHLFQGKIDPKIFEKNLKGTLLASFVLSSSFLRHIPLLCVIFEIFSFCEFIWKYLFLIKLLQKLN